VLLSVKETYGLLTRAPSAQVQAKVNKGKVREMRKLPLVLALAPYIVCLLAPSAQASASPKANRFAAQDVKRERYISSG
jgi:hypothetical protein